MTCVSCQQRREAIAAFARKAGTIVFGGRRQLARFSTDNRKEGNPAGLGEYPADSGTAATVAATVAAVGTAGEGGEAGGTSGGDAY